jgi:transcriptional regulator with XRE-family HTH domain
VSIGSNVRRLRGDRSQESLAFAADISVSTLSRLERDLHTPELATLQRLAAALGVSLSELIESADERKRPPS